MVSEIKTIVDFNSALNTDKLVIIDFFADWCGPCKNIAPFFNGLNKKYPNIDLYKINVENNNLAEIISSCKISRLPTFCYFINNICVDKVISSDQNAIEEQVMKCLALIPPKNN